MPLAPAWLVPGDVRPCLALEDPVDVAPGNPELLSKRPLRDQAWFIVVKQLDHILLCELGSRMVLASQVRHESGPLLAQSPVQRLPAHAEVSSDPGARHTAIQQSACCLDGLVTELLSSSAEVSALGPALGY